jgi:hypothetical protein
MQREHLSRCLAPGARDTLPSVRPRRPGTASVLTVDEAGRKARKVLVNVDDGVIPPRRGGEARRSRE